MNMKWELAGKKINDESMYQYFQDTAKNIFQAFSEEIRPYVPMRPTRDAIVGIYKSLGVLYSPKEVEEEVCLIDNVLEILNRYVRIEGMENLLINNYAVIENAIFLEHSSAGTPKRIREHYKHQFRNAYLGLLMLDEMKFGDCIETCLMKENNEYACYIMDCIRQDQEDGVQSETRHVLKEVIYKSYFTAALFHDVGYPLAYYFRVSEEIQNFSPFFKIINPGIKTEFSELKALLNNSLLFRTVDAGEIKKKYEDNDHGCLSAVSFLMNFYFSGSIYSLGKGKKNRCIVEMAAVAIYKHTNKYDGNHRMIFSSDPISYLLRICDDMQEWQRFMVLIEDTHNYLLCSACGQIIRPEAEDQREYGCGCGKQFRKITGHENKKVNYVDLCDYLLFSCSSEDHRIAVDFHYDYYRQIELLLSDYQSAAYRTKGLEELQIMLKCQKYIPEIELRYFLSNNPVKLIQKMIEESSKSPEDISKWIDDMDDGKRKQNLLKFYKEYEQALPDAEKSYGNEIEKDAVRYGGKVREFVERYLGEIYQVWNFLYHQEGGEGI